MQGKDFKEKLKVVLENLGGAIIKFSFHFHLFLCNALPTIAPAKLEEILLECEWLFFSQTCKARDILEYCGWNR